MSDQSTSDFDQLRQRPIFMEIMRQGPRDAAKVEAVLCAVLESVLEACEQDGLTMDQTYWLLEVHARAVIGAQQCSSLSDPSLTARDGAVESYRSPATARH